MLLLFPLIGKVLVYAYERYERKKEIILYEELTKEYDSKEYSFKVFNYFPFFNLRDEFDSKYYCFIPKSYISEGLSKESKRYSYFKRSLIPFDLDNNRDWSIYGEPPFLPWGLDKDTVIQFEYFFAKKYLFDKYFNSKQIKNYKEKLKDKEAILYREFEDDCNSITWEYHFNEEGQFYRVVERGEHRLLYYDKDSNSMLCSPFGTLLLNYELGQNYDRVQEEFKKMEIYEKNIITWIDNEGKRQSYSTEGQLDVNLFDYAFSSSDEFNHNYNKAFSENDLELSIFAEKANGKIEYHQKKGDSKNSVKYELIITNTSLE